MNNKILSYVGFAIKSNKMLRGTDSLKMHKRDIFLIILCKNASENTKKDIRNFAEYRHIPLMETTDYTVEELTNKGNCKVIGITDKNLATAILQNK